MEDCIFCQIASGNAKSWKVYETDHAYAFLDIHPVNAYHTLVIPKRHYVNIFDIPTEELLHVMSALKHVVDLYQERLGLANAQIVNSSGTEAQQDVFHLPHCAKAKRRWSRCQMVPPPGDAREIRPFARQTDLRLPW